MIVPAPRVLKVVLAIVFSGLIAQAHIGEQNIFFEGIAGPYPVRIVIRPPGVIPGLAEISIRVHTNGVQRVTALPMRWDSGRKGAPPPDEAKPVTGETNLFNTQLWFMRGGAQSVEVELHGSTGIGKVIVPVNAVATRVLVMSAELGWTLAALGILLVSLAVSIMGAAVRESVLPAGHTPSRKRLWFARGTVAVSTIGLAAFLWLGKRWWESEAEDYRNNRLYRPLQSTATVRDENGVRVLTFVRAVDPRRNNGPLVPEHGKLMHLFLVREPSMDAFAHLHPVKRDWKTFDAILPALPAGRYSAYADVTYETGFSDTLVATIMLPDAAGGDPFDRDDSWHISQPFSTGITTSQRVALGSGLWMELTTDPWLRQNRETLLRFAVVDVMSRPVGLDYFMGMGGHLILRRSDGKVFTHLHPSGTFSMAAQQLFEMRAEGKAPLRVASSRGDPICKLSEFEPGTLKANPHGEISFPYSFSQAGPYRLWVQIKVSGETFTGVFDLEVAPGSMAR